MTTLSPDKGYITLINTFDVRSDRADALVDLLARATEETMERLPGFVSANLHKSLDGRRVVNYAQWRSQRLLPLDWIYETLTSRCETDTF